MAEIKKSNKDNIKKREKRKIRTDLYKFFFITIQSTFLLYKKPSIKDRNKRYIYIKKFCTKYLQKF